MAGALLNDSTLCAIATLRQRSAYISTVYFAWTPQLRLVWLSDPAAVHSGNIRTNPSVAIAVFDSRQVWGKPDRGIQLFGSAFQLRGAAVQQAAQKYRDRFRRYDHLDLSAYRFYEFEPLRLKLYDEIAFGEGTLVTARVGPGGALTWERTEIFHGDS